LAKLPGVESAAVTSNLAFDFNDSHNQFRLLDRPVPSPADYPSASFRIVSRDYFRAMSIPLQQGRVFNGDEPMPSFSVDPPKMEQVLEVMRKLPMDVVVTRSFAQRYWPGQSPVGKGLLLGPPNVEIAHCTIVGVVGDSSQDNLGQTDHEEFYVSLRQFPYFPEYSLLMRTSQNPAALADAAKTQLRRMTATEAVYDVRPLTLRIASSISTNSFQTKLISAFAGLALLLASVGLYGVLAFNVGRRSREIGIRIALGASPGSVVGNVFLRGFAMVVPGLALGVLGAWLLARTLQNQLFEVSPTDPRTYAAGVAALLVSAFLACWFPARRAAKVDPMVALRDE
jgi:predicted permease